LLFAIVISISALGALNGTLYTSSCVLRRSHPHSCPLTERSPKPPHRRGKRARLPSSGLFQLSQGPQDADKRHPPQLDAFDHLHLPRRLFEPHALLRREPRCVPLSRLKLTLLHR
jgi:hypothetical protein